MADNERPEGAKAFTDSERAREIERAHAALSKERVAAAQKETNAKLDGALKAFVSDLDLPEEDSRVHDLRKVAAERGLEWPLKSSPPASDISAAMAPTKPSVEFPRGGRESEWRSPAAVSIAAGPTSAPKILVIDDDRDSVDTLATVLGEQGYRVWRAYDGFDGVLKLQEMPNCDLILLDVQMPKVDGREFLKYFDRSPHSHVPVVIISGGRKPTDVEFDDRFVFLGKPLDVESLLDVVKRQVTAGRGRA